MAKWYAQGVWLVKDNNKSPSWVMKICVGQHNHDVACKYRMVTYPNGFGVETSLDKQQFQTLDFTGKLTPTKDKRLWFIARCWAADSEGIDEIWSE